MKGATRLIMFKETLTATPFSKILSLIPQVSKPPQVPAPAGQ